MEPIYDMDKARYSSKSGAGQIKTNWYRLPTYTYSHTTYQSFSERNWTQDRIQYVKKSPKTKVKPCIHEKTHAAPLDDSLSYAEINGAFYTEVFITGISGIVTTAYPTLTHLSVHLNTSELGLSLADEVAGRIKPGLLSMATLGELGSLKELSLSLGSWVGTLKSLVGLPGLYQTGRKGTKLSDVVSAHLGWKFGVAPLLQDLAASVNVLDSVGKHLASLYRRNNLGWTQHSVAISGTSSELTGAMRTTRRTVRLTCEANGRFYVSAGDEIRTVLAHFGLDKPFSSAWELVPFSFILDYVLRIQDLAAWLDARIAQPIYNANVQIRNIQVTDKATTFGIYEYSYLMKTDVSADVEYETFQRIPLSDLNDIALFLDGLALHGMKLENAFTSGEVALAVAASLGKGWSKR